ncbi:Reverse transcriptase domain [Trinorchestia longiramus]|nr:Reverse transcriptase domain [Trinorchestia longiramus]
MSGFGLNVGEEKLSCLLYADDIVVVSKSEQELQMMLEIVDGYSRDFKVKFEGDKSKVMVINGDETDRDREWNIGEVKIGRTKQIFSQRLSLRFHSKIRHITMQIKLLYLHLFKLNNLL